MTRRPVGRAVLLRRLNGLGATAFVLPLLYLGAGVLWYTQAEFEPQQQFLVGPRWMLALGGERTPFLLGLLCVVAGGLAIAYGRRFRYAKLVRQGLWSFVAGIVLSAVYACLTF